LINPKDSQRGLNMVKNEAKMGKSKSKSVGKRPPKIATSGYGQIFSGKYTPFTKR